MTELNPDFDYEAATKTVEQLVEAAKRDGESSSVRFAGQLRILSDRLWEEGAQEYLNRSVI